MKKNIPFTLLLLLGSITIQAQVGIGVTNPNSSSILEMKSDSKGFLLPRLTTAQRNIITPTNNPALAGLMIYNTDLKCVEWYNGGLWNNGCGNQDAGSITAPTCSPTISGTLKKDVAASGVTATFTYTSLYGGSYPAQSITSTGVTGLTATLAAGNFSLVAGAKLTYIITGTPTGSGTANFAISIGGQPCSSGVNVTVSN